jgi:hypothetical protein
MTVAINTKLKKREYSTKVSIAGWQLATRPVTLSLRSVPMNETHVMLNDDKRFLGAKIVIGAIGFILPVG